VLLAGAAAVYGIVNGAAPDLALTTAVFGVSHAAYAANGAMILLCAMAYVRHKVSYTPIL